MLRSNKFDLMVSTMQIKRRKHRVLRKFINHIIDSRERISIELSVNINSL